ncbi:hypothetical protein ACFQO4_10045 [Saliphagus sp. GCM10025334]
MYSLPKPPSYSSRLIAAGFRSIEGNALECSCGPFSDDRSDGRRLKDRPAVERTVASDDVTTPDPLVGP